MVTSARYEIPEDVKAAVAWVRKHFQQAYYPHYRTSDGQPKYVLLDEVRGPKGPMVINVMPVHVLARTLMEAVPDFDRRPASEVKALLAESSRRRGLGLEPLLERVNGDAKGRGKGKKHA